MAQMNVSFDEAVLEDLRRLVPKRGRSAFIVAAVREKVEMLKQKHAAMKAAGVWSNEDRDDPEVDVRSLREDWQRRPQSLSKGR